MPRVKRLRLLWSLGLILTGILFALWIRTRYATARGEPYQHLTEKRGRAGSLPPTVHRTPPAAETAVEKYQDASDVRQCFLSNGATPFGVKLQHLPDMYLVFFGKPIMQSLKAITSRRGWIMKHVAQDSDEGLRELKALVSPKHLLVIFASSKTYHHLLIGELANSTNALVGTIGNAYKVTGSKQAQLASLRNHFQSYGCSLEDTAIMPRSFIIDNTKECIDFFKYSSRRPGAWWLLKPSSGQGGDGITIHSNMTHFYKEYATCMKSPDVIVQEYIANPLLLNNRKFDVRAYILLAKTSPYYLVFYHDGYLRVSVKEFDLYGGREVHLTNSHVQTAVDGFSLEKHFWTFEDLQQYLNKHELEDGKVFVSSKLVPFIQKVGLFIAHTAMPILSRATSNFLLMGLDFMITSDLHIQFIETNNYPLWPRGTDSLNNMIQTMGNDMFDVLLDCRQYPNRFKDMHPGDKYGTWTLIWNELYAHCTDSPPYDPCKEFLL